MAKIRSSGKSLSFTASSYNELAAVVYADIFDYPLTIKEAKLWAIRTDRFKNSEQKLQRVQKTISWLLKIPTIEAVFLTGSVATNNAKKDADIDLMIITKPNTLWLTRLFIFKFLRKPICPNIFLDTNHLAIQVKNLYTAHEILQAKILFDRNNIQQKWLKENSWAKEYLPNVYRHNINQTNHPISPAEAGSRSGGDNSSMPNSQSPNWLLDIGYWVLGLVIGFIELCAFLGQYLYMKSKMTNESVGWGYAFFHPNNLSKKVLEKFEQRLLKYKGK